MSCAHLHYATDSADEFTIQWIEKFTSDLCLTSVGIAEQGMSEW